MSKKYHIIKYDMNEVLIYLKENNVGVFLNRINNDDWQKVIEPLEPNTSTSTICIIGEYHLKVTETIFATTPQSYHKKKLELARIRKLLNTFRRDKNNGTR